MPTRGRALDAAAHVQAVDERFAVKFCYRQYTNQTDVAHCLLRNVRF